MSRIHNTRLGENVWAKLTRGDKDLEVPVAVRPTSEAVMYPCESIVGTRVALRLDHC